MSLITIYNELLRIHCQLAERPLECLSEREQAEFNLSGLMLSDWRHRHSAAVAEFLECLKKEKGHANHS